MTDEELRKFCLEQAVKVIASNPNARDLKGLCKVDAISVFDLSNAFIAYIKTEIRQMYTLTYITWLSKTTLLPL